VFATTSLMVVLISCSKSSDNPPAANVADDYVGNYVRTDTQTYTHPTSGTVITQYHNDGASISKVSASVVMLNQMPRYGGCDTAKATVTATSMVPVNTGYCWSGISNFLCTRIGTTLYYSYESFQGVQHIIKGKAVKQ
jgi:hypothetical protein